MVVEQPPIKQRAHIDVPEHLYDIPGAPTGWDWRPRNQRDIVDRIVNSPKKIIVLQAEPGSGKTTMAWAAAHLLGGQAVIMVRTRQLERQYLRDFPDLEMMEGRRHFICNISHTDRTADMGACTIGYKCPLAGRFDFQAHRYVIEPECNYFHQKSTTLKAKVSIHNYSYWLGETGSMKEASGFARPNFIVCDEAHEVESVLMSHEVVDLNPRIIRECGLEEIQHESWAELYAWATRSHAVVAAAYDAAVEHAQSEGLPIGDMSQIDPIESGPHAEPLNIDDLLSVHVNNIKALAAALDPLSKLMGVPQAELEADWIIDSEDHRTHIIKIRPVYGKRGMKRLLEAAQTKILFMSAYLAPELFIQTLGLNPDDVEIIEADRVFDRTNSPIIYMPVTKLSYKTEDYMWDRVVKVCDTIIDYYDPKKGLIHVPSVALRDRIVRGSRNRDRLVTYDGEYSDSRREGALNKDQAIEAFKAQDRAILLGQSISTGVDIPYHPQWQILVKMPFPPPTDPAMKERMARDKSYYVFLTICEIVQAAGRIKRAPDHDGPTIILDENFGWFYQANEKHFPVWFKEIIKWKWGVVMPRFNLSLMRGGMIGWLRNEK